MNATPGGEGRLPTKSPWTTDIRLRNGDLAALVLGAAGGGPPGPLGAVVNGDDVAGPATVVDVLCAAADRLRDDRSRIDALEAGRAKTAALEAVRSRVEAVELLGSRVAALEAAVRDRDRAFGEFAATVERLAERAAGGDRRGGDFDAALGRLTEEIRGLAEGTKGRLGRSARRQRRLSARIRGLSAALDGFAAAVKTSGEPPAAPRAPAEATSPVTKRATRSGLVKRLNALLGQIGWPQPLYHLTTGPGVAPLAARAYLDRALAVEAALGGNVANLKVLEAECGLGFNAFHLAARGASVTGLERHPLRVEACRVIGRLNGLRARFLTGAVDPDVGAVGGRAPFDFDAVLLPYEALADDPGGGLALARRLLERVPLVVAEGGPGPETFSGAGNGLRVRPLGRFAANPAGEARPLFAVWAGEVRVNRRTYPVESVGLKAYRESPVGGGRSYYFAGDHFVKKYRFGEGRGLPGSSREQIVSEVATLLDLRGRVEGVPRLVDFEVDGPSATVVLERVEGELLSDLLPGLSEADHPPIVRSLVAALAGLERAGYFHNDIRTWNVLAVPGAAATLLDLGLASPTPKERNVNAFLWLLRALRSGKIEGFGYDKDAPPGDFLEGDGLVASLARRVTSGGLVTFAEVAAALAEVDDVGPAGEGGPCGS